jgi:hypothetical protein
MAEEAAGRRRIDRVTAPDLLEDVADQPPEVLRALRDDCREEEMRLSYARRVVQGQLDVARMELARRREGSTEGAREQRDDEQLVEELSSVLADQPSSSAREARSLSFYTPGEEESDRRDDDLGHLPSLGQVPDLDDEGIAGLLEELEAQEARLSRARRAVLTNLDGLQAELVRRYREGEADLDAILSTALPRRREHGGGG